MNKLYDAIILGGGPAGNNGGADPVPCAGYGGGVEPPAGSDGKSGSGRFLARLALGREKVAWGPGKGWHILWKFTP